MRFPGIAHLPDPRRDGWGAFLLALVLREDGRLRQGWRILGFLLALFLTGLLVPVTIGLFFLGRPVPVWVQPFVAGLVCLVVSWGCLGVEGRPLASLGLWLDRRFLRLALTGLLGGLLLALLPTALLWLLGVYRFEPTSDRLPDLLAQGLLWAFATGFYEELLARGYPFQRLIVGLGPWSAQAILALTWMMIHGHTPGLPWQARGLGLLQVGLASFLLGQAWLRTRSLALPMGIHAGWVLAQGVLLGFPVGESAPPSLLVPKAQPDAPLMLTGGPGGLESSLPTVILFGVVFLLLLLGQRTARTASSADWEDTTRIF